MSSHRGRKERASSDDDEDSCTQELSTFTDADAPSLVFDAGTRSITIKQVLPQFAVDEHGCSHVALDTRSHQSLRRHRLGCRLLALALSSLARRCSFEQCNFAFVNQTSFTVCNHLIFVCSSSCCHGAIRGKAIRPAFEGRQCPPLLLSSCRTSRDIASHPRLHASDDIPRASAL
jgi:hypothetical protein